MIKKYIAVFGLLSIVSCASEKINLSPFSESFSIGNYKITEPSKQYNAVVKSINYSSEITNLIASFPKFKNDGVNLEVTNLKNNLEQYIYAVQAYNKIGEARAMAKFQKSYKKLQKLKSYLNVDEQEVLNRYLVRLKTNISMLESSVASKTQDSTSIK